MNWKRNPTLFTGICIALAVAVIIIALLVVYRKGTHDDPPTPPPGVMQQLPPPPPQRQQLPPQPHHQKQPSPEEDYHTTVGSGKPALVMFYAEWCGHSKNMMPAWEKVSQALGQSGQCECIALEQKKHGEEMQKHGVKGFPDIRFYPEGFPSQNSVSYRGNRSPESMMKFVQSGGKEM